MRLTSDGDDTVSDIKEGRHRYRLGEGEASFPDRIKPELGLERCPGRQVECSRRLGNIKLLRTWNLSSGPEGPCISHGSPRAPVLCAVI